MAGQMPPSNIDPSDLWAQITAMPRAHKIVKSPLKLPDGSEAEMIMQVLTQEEAQLCTIETERFTRKMLKDSNTAMPKSDEKSEGYNNLYETRCAAEILFKACRQIKDINKPFFPGVNELSKKLTTDQIGCLMNQYLIIQQELGPIVSEMEQYEFDAWIEKLATGGSAHFLGLLTLGARNQLTMYMASQLHSLRTDKCLPISQQEEKAQK